MRELQLELDREKGREPVVKVRVLSENSRTENHTHHFFFFDQGVFVASVRHPDGGGGIPRHTEAPEQSQTAR